jgi:hypothetical protein
MARKKGSKKKSSSSSSKRKREGGDQEARPRRREIRPYIYAAFNFFFLIVYFVLFTKVAPSRHASASAIGYLMMLSVVVMGAGVLVRNRWGWRASVAGCAALLILALVLFVLILMSAGFLAGVYGAFGKAASMFALVAAALVIELVALLPAFQLKFLLTRSGRRWFGQEPLWR